MGVEGESEFSGITVDGVVGHGASAVVYVGTQDRLGRRVAVKVLDQARAFDEEEGPFRRECLTLGRLAPHPNILTIFDAGFTLSGRPYLVTEYLPGGTLAERLVADGPLGWREVLDIGVQLCGALETTHRHGIAHGDVKPQNVLVGRMGQPVLADFGIARTLSAVTSSVSVLTPLHAAPEIFDGAPPAPASDVYGLGSTLFTLLEGNSPVGASTDLPLVIMRRVAAGERSALSVDGVPDHLRRALEASLDPDPDRRPATAEELGARLRAAQEAEGISPTPLSVMSSTQSGTGTGDLGEPPAGGGPAELTLPPTEQTLPPTEQRVPAASRRPVVLAVSAAMGIIAVLVGGWFLLDRSTGGKDPEADAVGSEPNTVADAADVSGEGGDTVDPGVLASGRTQDDGTTAGLLPGVEYEVEGEVDTSAQLEVALREEGPIFLTMDGAEVQPQPLYGLLFDSLPAQYRFRAFNVGVSEGELCGGMTTGDLVLTGLWERRARPESGVLHAVVAEMGDAEMAGEMYTVMSLSLGAVAEECYGMDVFGVSDPASYGVVHRDMKLGGKVPANLRHNTWITDGPEVAGVTYQKSVRILAQRGAFLVDIALLTNGTLTYPDDEVISGTVNEILRRL